MGGVVVEVADVLGECEVVLVLEGQAKVGEEVSCLDETRVALE